MNPERLLTASTAVGLWVTSAGATDSRPEDAVRHIGENARAEIGSPSVTANWGETEGRRPARDPRRQASQPRAGHNRNTGYRPII
jgi:hypothetical protein